METQNLKASRTIVDITIDGKNVTGYLNEYLIGVTFNDKTSCEVDDITITLEDRDEKFSDEWMPMIGDPLTVQIVTTNIDGSQDILECGDFEIDLVTDSGPPNICQIKAVNTVNSPIRKVLRSKQWKNMTLGAICEQIANTYQLKYQFIGADITENGKVIAIDDDNMDISEVNQSEQSDLAFLVKLADDYGYVVKLDDEQLILCAQDYLEAQEPTASFDKDELANRQAGRQGFDIYKEVTVRYISPKTKKVKKARAKAVDPNMAIYNKEWLAAHSKQKQSSKKSTAKKSDKTPTKPLSYFANNGGSKTLVIRQYFSSDKAAEKFARAQLQKKNRGEWKLSAEVKGEVSLLAGTVIYIDNYGQYEGLYYVEETTHSVGTNGYRTSFTAHKVSNTGN